MIFLIAILIALIIFLFWDYILAGFLVISSLSLIGMYKFLKMLWKLLTNIITLFFIKPINIIRTFYLKHRKAVLYSTGAVLAIIFFVAIIYNGVV